MIVGVIAEELLMPSAIVDSLIVREAANAADLANAGFVFPTLLVDDPASASEQVDAYFGMIMLEAASAADTLNATTGAVGTTWNPADAGSTLVFSNANLTVTASSTIQGRSVRGTSSKTTGKWYFEVTCTGTMGHCGVGVADATALTNATAANGAAYINVFNSQIFNNNNFVGGPFFSPSWSVGDVCCIALDLSNRMVWFRKNNGTWNGSYNTANGDPAANVNGIDLSSWVSVGTAIFPLIAFNTTNALSQVGNFGPTAVYTIPSGFTFWG